MSKLSKAIANAIIEFNAGLLTQDELFEKLEQDIDNVSVKVFREDTGIPLPTYGKEGDACCDVYAKSIEYDADKDRTIIHTGLHFALPMKWNFVLVVAILKQMFICPIIQVLLIGVIEANFLLFSRIVLIFI